MEMYKIKHDLSPSFMNSIFPFSDNPYILKFKIKKHYDYILWE